VKAKSEGLAHEEAWCLLKANKWNECHSVILKHVASEAIINGAPDSAEKGREETLFLVYSLNQTVLKDTVLLLVVLKDTVDDCDTFVQNYNSTTEKVNRKSGESCIEVVTVS
jgi:hypothetical protein